MLLHITLEIIMLSSHNSQNKRNYHRLNNQNKIRYEPTINDLLHLATLPLWSLDPNSYYEKYYKLVEFLLSDAGNHYHIN